MEAKGNAYMLGDPDYMLFEVNMLPCVNANTAAKPQPSISNIASVYCVGDPTMIRDILEFIVMLGILVFLFFVVLPFFGGSDYPDMGDLVGLIGNIIKVIV